MCFGKKPAVHSEGFKNIVEQNKQFLKQLFKQTVLKTILQVEGLHHQSSVGSKSINKLFIARVHRFRV